MIEAKYFKDEAYKDRIMEIHTLVSLTLSQCRRKRHAWYHLQNEDERWLDKNRSKDALRILDCLDFFLDKGMLDAYQEQFEVLWPLLNESKVGPLIHQKIALEFGADCFFLQYD